MEGASKHEVFVAAKLRKAFAEVSLEDETTGFVYYEECEDNPGRY